MPALSLAIRPAVLTVSLQSRRNAPLPLFKKQPTASAPYLAPLHLPREITGPVSYYAFFKGLLLLSQPPGCISNFTSFYTEYGLGGLSRWSGLFPFRHRTLSPHD